MLDVEKTALEGLLILTPRRFGDARGFFAETWNRARLKEQAGDDSRTSSGASTATQPSSPLSP